MTTPNKVTGLPEILRLTIDKLGSKRAVCRKTGLNIKTLQRIEQGLIRKHHMSTYTSLLRALDEKP